MGQFTIDLLDLHVALIPDVFNRFRNVQRKSSYVSWTKTELNGAIHAPLLKAHAQIRIYVHSLRILRKRTSDVITPSASTRRILMGKQSFCIFLTIPISEDYLSSPECASIRQDVDYKRSYKSHSQSAYIEPKTQVRIA